jgi:hypothetical protein
MFIGGGTSSSAARGPGGQCSTSLKRDVRFSAVGYAVLRKDIAHPDDWVDPRPQTVTLGCREFSTETQCTEILMGEIRVLIDALRKSP